MRLRQWFDPTEVGAVGTTPDYRFSLANERTFLAWIRTGLALIGGGLAVAAFVPPLALAACAGGRSRSRCCFSVPQSPCGLWTTGPGAERAMRLGQPLPRSRFPAVLALVTAAGAVVLLVLVFAAGMRP